MICCKGYHGFREPLTERHVQAIWYDRVFRPKHLWTREGDAVRVVDPGEWNLGAGPDFKNAVLEIGEGRIRKKGDIEVHLNPSAWRAHGHGDDPAYQNVIAHVTWGCGPAPTSLPPQAVSIWLGRFVTAHRAFAPEEIDLSAYPFARISMASRPCYDQFCQNPQLATEVLFAAGAHRIQTKAARLRSLLALRPLSRAQIFYEEVMAALGYKRNAPGFRQVAEVVPYDRLVAEPENAASALLTAADFVEWDTVGLRPANQPRVRLQAAAELFTHTAILELSAAASFRRQEVDTMMRILTADHLVGRARAAAILANVVLPFALACEQVETVPRWLPPEDVSEPVRLTAHRLFGRDHNPLALYAKNGIAIQGLLQIHRDYCLRLHPDCTGCSVYTQAVKGVFVL